MNLLIAWLDRLHWLWLILAAPFMLFPSPTRTLAMLIVPALWILRWVVLRGESFKKGSVLDLRPSIIGQKPSVVDESQSPKNPAYASTTRTISLIPMPVTPLNSIFLLMFVMVLISTWATYDIMLSLEKISGVVLGLGVFFAIVREGKSLLGWWLSLLVFLGAGVAVAVAGLLGTDWPLRFGFLEPLISRLPNLLQGLPGAESGLQYNAVGGTLLWILPMLLVFSVYSFNNPQRLIGSPVFRWLRGSERKKVTKLSPWFRRISQFLKKLLKSNSIRKKTRKIGAQVREVRLVWLLLLTLGLSTLLVTAVLILTQSRGSYLSMVIAGLSMLFVVSGRRWRFGLTIGTVVFGLMLGGLLVRAGGWDSLILVLGNSSLPGVSVVTFDSRVEIWSRAIYGIQDFPITGMGMNTFREIVHVLYPLFLISPNVDLAHAHNEFLQIALDLGIPGLISFLAVNFCVLWILKEVWKTARQNALNSPRFLFASPEMTQMIVLGLFGGHLAHLLFGLTDAIALGAKPGVLWWMLLGLIVALHAQVSAANIKTNMMLGENIDYGKSL